MFDQRDSNSTEDQDTYMLSRDQGRVGQEVRAQQRIKTLTACQGIRNAFSRRGLSSTDDQDTHKLSRDQGRVWSARLELNRGLTHSHPVRD
jgi:hypothetical protein